MAEVLNKKNDVCENNPFSADSEDANSYTHVDTTVSAEVEDTDCDQQKSDIEQMEQEEEKMQLQLNSHRSHDQSSMTNLLVEYGLPHNKNAKKVKKVKKSKRQRSIDSFDDRDLERMRAKDERYRSVYKDVHKLKKFMYDDYMDRLQDRVQDQRKQIQKKTEESDNRLMEKERKKRREEENRLKTQKQRQNLKHDKEYLKNVQKSQYYKIVEVEERLTAQGRLKTRSEFDEFWEDMQRSDSYSKFFSPTRTDEVNKSFVTNYSYESLSRSSSLGSLADRERGLTDFRPMTQIEETRETSRPGTQQGQEAVSHKAPQTGKLAVTTKQKEPSVIAREAAIALDQKCPMLELPNFYCFRTELSEKPPDPQEILAQMGATRREKERKLLVKRLRKMYHLSQSNIASTQRILDKHGDEFDVCLRGPQIDEVIAIDELTKDKRYQDDDDEVSDKVEDQPWLRYVKRDIAPIQEVSEDFDDEETKSEASTKTSTSSIKRILPIKSNSLPNTPPERLPPLSMNDLSKNRLVSARCLSSNWTNYLKAGKSIFAPS